MNETSLLSACRHHEHKLRTTKRDNIFFCERAARRSSCTLSPVHVKFSHSYVQLLFYLDVHRNLENTSISLALPISLGIYPLLIFLRRLVLQNCLFFGSIMGIASLILVSCNVHLNTHFLDEVGLLCELCVDKLFELRHDRIGNRR